jgi:uncharacterized protein
MLRLNVRDLRDGPATTTGTLQPGEPAFAGLGLRFLGPVEVSGDLQATGDEDYLWRGHVTARFEGECRRCLADVTLVIDDDLDAVLSGNPDLADDPTVYPIDAAADTIDLTPVVREELVLRVSAFPLCRPDCKGLCPKCGADLNAGPCGCTVTGSTN